MATRDPDHHPRLPGSGKPTHLGSFADPFSGHIDEFRIAHVQRSDGWIETVWNNVSDPRFVFHYTPTSGSWLNAVETFFSALTRCR